MVLKLCIFFSILYISTISSNIRVSMAYVTFSPMSSLSNWVLMGTGLILGSAQLFINMPYRLNLVVLLVGIIAFALGLSRTNQGKVFSTYLADTKKELKRVTWPTNTETIRSVWLVAATVFIASLFWWLIDSAITKI